MAKTLADVHPDVIQTHILPLLDGPSLSATATTSDYLHTLCSDENLWSHICNSTWPSITTDPRLHDIISTFPAGHRSFFQDSFPALVTAANHRHNRRHLDLSSQPYPSQIISAVDINYKNNIIYSKVEFTDTTDDFLSSDLRIELNQDPESKHGPETEATLLDVKESLSLSWIIIDPTRKRAGNISSVKPVSAWKGWMNDDTYLQYVTVLPGCDENKMVECRIQVIVGENEGSMGLKVKEVKLELLDLDFCRLKGKEFLVITQGALSGESNVKREMVNDDEVSRSWYKEFKRISINSLCHLQSEIQDDVVITPRDCFLQKLFHFLKVIIGLKI